MSKQRKRKTKFLSGTSCCGVPITKISGMYSCPNCNRVLGNQHISKLQTADDFESNRVFPKIELSDDDIESPDRFPSRRRSQYLDFD